MWDDPESYDASYERANEWGERRYATPGAIIDGQLVTTKLNQINIGLEEFIEHSYYEDWNQNGQRRYQTDPSGIFIIFHVAAPQWPIARCR